MPVESCATSVYSSQRWFVWALCNRVKNQRGATGKATFCRLKGVSMWRGEGRCGERVPTAVAIVPADIPSFGGSPLLNPTAWSIDSRRCTRSCPDEQVTN